MAIRASNSLGTMPTGSVMRTVNELVVHAPARLMYDLAADVESWPKLLPHYRYVRFRERQVGGGVVEMSAHRPFGLFDWPTWWVSLMDVRPHANRPDQVIRFRHIEGITARMEVEWEFSPLADDRNRVRIVHSWDGPGWPVIGALAAKVVIGPLFVHGIASRTLAGLAAVAERRQNSARA
jgi:ribosome-associated toxin RatA of RatAB toxin-antitoxin module